MKVIVDEALCSGHARCNAMAPLVYTLDDVGYCDLRGKGEIEIEASLEDAARLGARSCPEGAITVVE